MSVGEEKRKEREKERDLGKLFELDFLRDLFRKINFYCFVIPFSLISLNSLSLFFAV